MISALCTVLLLGDSLTAGVVGTPGGATLAFPDSWGGQVQAALAGEAEVTPLTGAFGFSLDHYTPGAVEFEELVRPSLPADVAVLWIGYREVRLGIRAWRVLPGIRLIARELKRSGVKAVLLPTYSIPRGPPINALFISRLNALLRFLGQQPRFREGPDLERLLDPVLHHEGGDIHLNQAGHDAAAVHMAAAIRSACSDE